MAELGYFNNHGRLEIENVLRPEQVQAASAFAKLPIIKGFVICLPGDERNIEVSGDTELRTELSQFGSFNWRRFESCANSVQGVCKLTEPMMRVTCLVHLLRDICRKCDSNSAWQGRLPSEQMPRVSAALIFSALNEGRFNDGLGAQQMFPLIPTRIPCEGQCTLIKHDFALPAGIPIDRTIAVEVAFSQ